MHGSVPPGSRHAAGETVFEHVLVGIDETPESVIAAAQAGVLRAPAGRLVLVGAVERHLAVHAGLGAAHAEDDLEAETAAELERARELVDADDVVHSAGSLVDLLCAECGRRDATLVAVGVRPHRRLSALVFGGHDVEALHNVECSVLIARPGWGATKPQRILVGVDGSPEARVAEAAAGSLAARLGSELVPVIGLGDDVDTGLLRAERDGALLDPAPLADALASASTRADLVVVGRARERGRRWGGSLVERVVYSARCSVLVVNG